MIGVYMCNTYKGLKSLSCVTHGMENKISVYDTYVGLDILPCVTYLL